MYTQIYLSGGKHHLSVVDDIKEERMLRTGQTLGIATLGTLVVYHQLTLKAGLSEPDQDLPTFWTSHGRDSVRARTAAHHINKLTNKHRDKNWKKFRYDENRNVRKVYG